jgi:hypothetical protein
MSPDMTGTQIPTTNDQNPQVRGHSSSTTEESVGEQRELAPDRPPVDETAKPKRPRGFAAMDRKLVSEIARKGGKAAHSAGTAHEFTSEEARVAGQKGGRATHAKRRTSARPEAAEATPEEKGS